MRTSAYAATLGGLLGLSSAAVIGRSAVELKPIRPDVFVPGLAPRSEGEAPTVLRPINADVFEAVNGLKPRADVDFSRLDLADQAQLIFGAPGQDGNIMLANMTLYAPGGQQIVSMETFEGLASAVDCKGDDGEMALTFKSQEAFDYAHTRWSFINEKSENAFLLIANHDGCGPDDQRQPYNITEIHDVEGTLTKLLKASPAKWSDISGTFDLDFGTASLTPNAAQRLRARGFLNHLFDDAKDIVDDDGLGDIGDIFGKIGDADLDKTVVFDIGVGTKGKRTNIIGGASRPDASLVIDCVDCFITGKFKVAGKLSVDNFVVKEMTLAASPDDFRAKMIMEAKVSATISTIPPSLNLTRELASFPIPAAGISIPKIFELGAIIAYEVGVESSINGVANFTFGLGASLPNTALVAVNLADLTKSQATGFDGATFDPVFDLHSGSATLNVAAVSRPKLTFGIEVVGVGKLEAALKMGLPVVNTQLTAAFDEKGVCEKSPKASKTGFKVNSGVAVELVFSVDGKLGDKSAGLFEKTLFRLKKMLFEKCFPLNIPNLKSGPKRRQVAGLLSK
ncbi:hypothetical protein C7212DRAFT_225177 [Tuber magnatum]|uniref:Uncharacterized protein n=1 Tax=Tuber magnatum TaxID=42249 RepID=A0A317SGL1_9PEZI|nr:hypothetical protein C7212DRAFT_225177 [Tuber magnatum]